MLIVAVYALRVGQLYWKGKAVASLVKNKSFKIIPDATKQLVTHRTILAASSTRCLGQFVLLELPSNSQLLLSSLLSALREEDDITHLTILVSVLAVLLPRQSE